ncbi:hypothetical protein IAT38_003383 [Cryptococcus sp. DSM 104549]
MPSHTSFISFTLALAILPNLADAFSFYLGTKSPTTCQDVEITWSGGESPWSLTIIPAYDYPSTVSIPDSAYDSSTNSGSYSWTVNYPSGTSFVAMMSDGSGTGTGGVSPLYNVSGQSASSCDMRSESTDFLFYLNRTTITQCEGVEVYWDSTAVAPVSIIGAIPGGQVFQLVSSNSKTTSLVWDTNIEAGTEVIIAAFDSGTYGQGGSSNILTIGGSSDDSCINDASPSSTSSGAATTQTGTSTGGTKTSVGGIKTVTAITTETAAPKGAAGLSTGAIVGIVVSAVLVVVALQAALLWFCCRRQIRSLIYHRREMRGHEIKPGGEVDLGLATRHSMSSARDLDHYPSPITDMYQSPAHTRASRYSLARSAHGGAPATSAGFARSRSGDDLDAASSISPFWDGRAVSVAGDRPPTIGPLGFDSELEPPRALGAHDHHGRNDSLSSMALTIPETIDEGGFPSPAFSQGSTMPLVGGAGGQSPQSPAWGGPSAAAGAGSSRSLTKAQMAASLSAHNPDLPAGPAGAGAGAAGARRDDFGARLPPQEAPAGGFRRHEDAGRVDGEGEGASVEDLPPMYRPEWETDSQRRASRG